MKLGQNKIKIFKKSIVRIISDATITTKGLSEGLMIPLLIIDTTDRSDIVNLVKIHEKSPSGDVKCRWGYLQEEKNKIVLYLEFERPVETQITILFDILSQGILVDIILTSRAVYLQPGKEGDRLANSFDNPRIVVEIPKTDFAQIWQKIFFKHLTSVFRNKGLNRKQAKEATREYLNEMRKITRFRMK